MTAPGFEELPGRPLPEGSFTITGEDEILVLEVLGGEPSGDGIAHPLWAYIAPQRGIGIGIAELCALAGFDVNDGPMLGSSRLEYYGQLHIGIPYRVTGEIIDIVRKHGSIGTFDVLEFRENLLTESEECVATSTSTYILPRRAS
jgi:hypothetical protein